jgi:hypothetical protein
MCTLPLYLSKSNQHVGAPGLFKQSQSIKQDGESPEALGYRTWGLGLLMAMAHTLPPLGQLPARMPGQSKGYPRHHAPNIYKNNTLEPEVVFTDKVVPINHMICSKVGFGGT